jgi:hypothetical protein
VRYSLSSVAMNDGRALRTFCQRRDTFFPDGVGASWPVAGNRRRSTRITRPFATTGEQSSENRERGQAEPPANIKLEAFPFRIGADYATDSCPGWILFHRVRKR